MNILIFSWRGIGHPNAGGAEIVTFEHARAWVNAGHKVTLFTSSYRGCKKNQLISGVNIIHHGNEVLGVQVAAFFWYLFKTNEVFDLVVDEFHGIPFFTPLYIKKSRLAFIHEVTKEVWKLNSWPSPLNFLPGLLGPIIEPFIFKFIYKNTPFMTVSNSTKKELMEWGISGENICIIHNGVNKPDIKSSKKTGKIKTLIFLGAVTKDKGVGDALKAFLILINKFQADFEFWIVGKGEARYINYLKSQLGKEVLSKIKFFGFVDEKKKFQLLAKADILIHPSVREGWGLVVIEAASVGTPTIGFNSPGLNDSIIDNQTGIICKSNTSLELAEIVDDLSKNQAKYQSLSEKAIIWSKNFSWKKSTQESLNLINKLSKLD